MLPRTPPSRDRTRVRRIALAIGAAWLAAVSLACASTAATVNVERDEFTGQTEMRAEALMPPLGFTVLLATSRERAQTSGGFMMFSRPSERWRYLRCHSVHMLVDGRPVALGDSDHDGAVFSGGVSEHVTVDLDPAALRLVTTAREVRVRVCNDAWTLSQEMLSAMWRIGRELGFTRPGPAVAVSVDDGP